MKNIENFKSPKYDDPRYEMVLPDIYKVTRKVNDNRLSTKFTQLKDIKAIRLHIMISYILERIIM